MTVKMEDGRGVIRLGDKTDHGGVVVQVAHDVTDMGKLIACKGDMVKCPKCKGTFPIVEGEATWTIDGVPIAFHGHKTACGAILLSSWGKSASYTAPLAAPAEPAPQNNLQEEDEPKYDRFLVFEDQDGKPLGGIPYKLTAPDGAVIEGKTDSAGKCSKIKGRAGEKLAGAFASKGEA